MDTLLPAPTGIFDVEITSDKRRLSIPEEAATLETALPQALVDAVAEASKASRADNTKRAYRAAWSQFASWCDSHGRVALPASGDTIKAWLVTLAADLKVKTIEVKLAAVANAHRVAGLPFDRSLMVGLTLDGIRNKLGTATDGAKAIGLDELRAAIATLPATVAGARDRALLLVGFWGALRRSEIVSIDAAHIEIVPQGIKLTIPRSKTDQKGAGQVIGLPRRNDDLCPVAALQAWLAVSGICGGAVFVRILKGGALADRLTAQSVRLIIQKRTGRDDLTAHGLRSGFVTEAARRRVSAATIRRTTRHTNDRQVEGYIRDARLFDDLAHDAFEVTP